MTDPEDPMLQFHRCGSPLEWRGCYEAETVYKKYIHAESMKHPAKMAMSLCERIFEHLEKEGYLKPDMVVVDPMSGTGRTNIIASLRGYNSISIELEDKFVTMQERNRELLKTDKWSIIKGDARKLSELLKTGGVGITSPPYGMDVKFRSGIDWEKAGRPDRLTPSDTRRNVQGCNPEGYGPDKNNIGNLPDTPMAGITSPPYADTNITTKTNFHGIDHKGCLAKDMRREGYAGIVSPPHGDSLKGGGGPNYYEFLQRAKGLSPEEWKMAEREWQRNHRENMARYSQDDKNIGNLKDVELIGITSPPFLEAQTGGGIAKNGYRGKHMKGQGRNQPDKMGERCGYCRDVHENTEGQIGNYKDEKLAGITSPPYEKSVPFHDKEFMIRAAEQLSKNQKDGTAGGNYASPEAKRKFAESILPKYSEDPANIGNHIGNTYQGAMLEVYREAFKSGISPLVTVTKNPTKNKKIRRLDLDTVALLQAAGYEIVDHHRAILFDVVSQKNLDGTVTRTPHGRMSFFKRLAFDKGSPVAQWEDVIIAV